MRNYRLIEDLSVGFLRSPAYLSSSENASSKDPFQLATGWYLTDHPDGDTLTYTQATQMKILASIDAQQLDVVLMDMEAFDAFAQNGYLMDLHSIPELEQQYASHFVANMEIIEDNAKEIALDPSIPYNSVTKEYPMALDLSNSPLFQKADLTGTVYLGVISNTSRMDMTIRYVDYLFRERN